MNQVLIFSDNQTLIKLWSTTLSSLYQVNTIDKLYADIKADIIIIDTHKIDNNDNLFSFFNKQSSRFLIVGNSWSEDNQIKALVHGAAGYCGEIEPPELLIQAVKSILKGDIWIQRHLVPQVIGTLVQMKSAPVEEAKEAKSAESSELLKTLSNRELDVTKMIGSGENNKTIASTLNISERTVKAHLTSIFKKLNISDRLHLALFVQKFG
ncbi:MAG: DNA-binding response regulator [Methylomarinum sp.]|nr:DNA-binding response regulator [Methylomarinum sp.]